jgi:hypothetical protein
MGLNLSNHQIAAKLEMNEDSIQGMTTILRNGIVAQEPLLELEGTVECDEVYVIAGHKGHPEAVKKRAQGSPTAIKRTAWPRHCDNGQAARLRHDSTRRSNGLTRVGECSAGGDSTNCRKIYQTGDTRKYRRIQHLRTLAGMGVRTQAGLSWGWRVCEGQGDGFHEVHVNTIEGVWSLLRSWLRPHRGVSQERLPIYVGFFLFVHNVRRRGNSLLRALVETLVATNPERR